LAEFRQSLVIEEEVPRCLEEAVADSTYRKQEPQPKLIDNKEFVRSLDFRQTISHLSVKDVNKSFKDCAKNPDKIE
jgi:hypothetical protein